jgi:hypothetical protein
LILVAFLVVRFGHLTVNWAANSSDFNDNLEDAFAERETTAAGRTEKPSLTSRVGSFVGTFGVKLKILISLYQVLTSIGTVFKIPYPDEYSELLNDVSAIELNLPSLLPLDCLFGGISFLHVLIIQTAVPAVVIFLLETAAKILLSGAGAVSEPSGGNPSNRGAVTARN